MSKTFEKAVTGFNHNIKHKGKMYHVQTEDSGINNPHVITHLFVGGNIIASKKTSYADIVGAENLQQVVRELMEEQHKGMLRNLVNGVYDHLDLASPSYQPGQLAIDPAPPAAPNPAPKAEPVPPPPQVPPPPTRAPITLTHANRTPPVLAPAAPRASTAVTAVPLPAPARAQPKRTETPADSLFGENLISEKSLDEVILSYLAGDNDPG